MVLEHVASQLLDEADCLHPFQSDFRLAYGRDTAFIALEVDLCQKRDSRSFPLILLELSADFVYHQPWYPLGLLVDASFHGCSNPSWRVKLVLGKCVHLHGHISFVVL